MKVKQEEKEQEMMENEFGPNEMSKTKSGIIFKFSFTEFVVFPLRSMK